MEDTYSAATPDAKDATALTAEAAALEVCSCTANSLKVHVCVAGPFSTAHLVILWRKKPITGQEITEADSFLEFHFLPQAQDFEIRLLVNGALMARSIARTAEMERSILRSSQGMQSELFVSEAHMPFGSWIMEHRGNWLWSAKEAGCWSSGFFNELFRCGLFALPVDTDDSMMPIINPESRYCIDLRASTAATWEKSKRVRRHKRDFKLSVNRSFEKSLRALQQYHEIGGATWMNERLFLALVAMQGQVWNVTDDKKEEKKGTLIDHCVFELWEPVVQEANGSSGSSSTTSTPTVTASKSISTTENILLDGHRLVAVVAGFGLGRVWHDYSMCTLLKDRRSVGALLTKAVGQLLKKCGYDVYYWGCKVTCCRYPIMLA